MRLCFHCILQVWNLRTFVRGFLLLLKTIHNEFIKLKIHYLRFQSTLFKIGTAVDRPFLPTDILLLLLLRPYTSFFFAVTFN